jgi:hypothetical protein
MKNRARDIDVRKSKMILCTLLLGLLIPAQASDQRDIYSSVEYVHFIQAIAIPTARAETRPGDFVKFLQIGKNEDGEVVVSNIGLLSIGEHAMEINFDGGADVIVVAHVHHKLMEQSPTKEDGVTVRRLGIPNFVISADGQLIWEVGIVSGKAMYRDASPKRDGHWMVLK